MSRRNCFCSIMREEHPTDPAASTGGSPAASAASAASAAAVFTDAEPKQHVKQAQGGTPDRPVSRNGISGLVFATKQNTLHGVY